MRFRLPCYQVAFILLSIGVFPAPGWAAFDSATAAKAKDLSIERITPTGDNVPSVGGSARQIVIQFNRPVVPVGEMARKDSDIPVVTQPKIACEWRWLNTSALACQLGEKEALAPATAYHMTVNPGIKAEDGTTIAAPYTHQFTTERPDVTNADFKDWQSPSMPRIRVTLNQPVTKSSLEAHLFFLNTEGSQTRMALTAFPYVEKNEEKPFLAILEQHILGLFKPVEGKADDQMTRVGNEEARRVWLVAPKEELQLDHAYDLQIEPGLVSPQGPEKGNRERNIVSFTTFPDFRFIGISCRDNSNTEVRYLPGTKAEARRCNPMGSVAMVFSAPVSRAQLKAHLDFTPDLAGGRKDYDPWNIGEEEEGGYDESLLESHRKDQEYIVWLPAGLRSDKEYHISGKAVDRWSQLKLYVLELFGKPVSGQLVDEFGRKLAASIDIAFATDHRKPNYEFPYSNAVLESGVESEIPLWVGGLRSYSFSYHALFADGRTKEDTYQQALPAVQDAQYAVPFGLRQMLEGRSGAVYGSLSSDPVIPEKHWEPAFFGQVTPYNLHVKLGHFNTLVWATDWATGKPVPGAKVSIYLDDYSMLAGPLKPLAEAATNDQGFAMLPGTETLDPNLNYTIYPPGQERMFISVRKGAGQALLPLDSANEVNIYRASGESIWPRTEKKYGHMHSWGTTAQGVYRSGDVVDYKIFVRQQDNLGFVPPPKGPYRLKIIDPKGKMVHQQEGIMLSEFGAFAGQFTAPKQGAVGWYVFKLSARFDGKPEKDKHEPGDDQTDREGEDPQGSPDGKSFYAEPLKVLIADFTPAPFHVTNSVNGERFEPGQEIAVDTQAKLHAGGPYADAPLRVTTLLQGRPFTSKNPKADHFLFGGTNDYEARQIDQKDGQINDKGEQQLKIALTEQSVPYGTLTIESSVKDDRGKYVSSRASADYVGVSRFVGLRSSEWMYQSGKPMALDTIVTDEKGDPAAGSVYNVLVERREAKAAKVKGAGNAYLTDYTYEWVKAAECNLTSKLEAQPCGFTPDKAGDYRATASVQDAKGREHKTELSFWVTGNDYVLWDNGDTGGLDVLPEKTELKIGDKARYLIKNPYPGAKALITIERYGVLDSFEQTLEGSTPVIEFPVKPDYVPGFYLSVTVFSPRVEKPVPKPGTVDLGKPAYRMGYVAVPVNDPAKIITITAKADKEVYRPRDTVTLSVHAEPKLAQAKKEPVEITVAVLDDAVFDLITSGKAYYDPYKGFYTLDGIDVRNFDLSSQLIGRQKFEKKGATPGGDGGSSLAMRNDFKFVSYWNTGQVLDAAGNATVHFPVPDNLTSWHVMAIAVTPSDRMGLGEASFKVNRPTELRPVMPNQVMEGDHFTAGFSVMNRTDKPRDVTVEVKANGILKEGAPLTISKKLTLAPFKREVIELPLIAGKLPEDRDVAEGSIHFTATGGDATDKDGTEFTLPVKKWRSLETAATYGTTTEGKVSESIAFPKDIHPDVGQVSAVLSPSVIANLSGAFTYVRDYLYLCWEQRLTKGVMAAHYMQLKAYLPDSLKWDEAKDLPQRMLEDASSFQAPNGGMAYFVATDERADPYLSAFTALSFNWLRKDGYTVPEDVEKKLQGYLQNMLKQDVMPTFYNKGMQSDVRAVALAALAGQGKATLADLERYRPHVPEMSLFGKTHFLLASMQLKAPAAATKKVAEDILAHSNQSGGKVVFSEELDDSYKRMLSSPLRENCAILGALTEYGETAEGGAYVADLPVKLARTITQTRGKRDHWENTQENLFCMNALTDYSRAYEKEKPAMTITAALDAKPMGSASFRDLRDLPVTLSTPITPNDPGRKATLNIEKQGAGRLYYSARLQYAPTGSFDQPINAGMDLHREYQVERGGKWVVLASPMQIKRGELVRVDLYLSLPTARNFVVVDDPVPGGLEPLNRDLATTSVTDANKGEFKRDEHSWYFHFGDWNEYQNSEWSFYHQELRHDAVRFYSDYLPAGNYHLTYTAQAIANGTFAVLPTKAEEMYDPDIFGKTPAAELRVGEIK